MTYTFYFYDTTFQHGTQQNGQHDYNRLTLTLFVPDAFISSHRWFYFLLLWVVSASQLPQLFPLAP